MFVVSANRLALATVSLVKSVLVTLFAEGVSCSVSALVVKWKLFLCATLLDDLLYSRT